MTLPLMGFATQPKHSLGDASHPIRCVKDSSGTGYRGYNWLTYQSLNRAPRDQRPGLKHS